jgi:hypothetical protein
MFTSFGPISLADYEIPAKGPALWVLMVRID